MDKLELRAAARAYVRAAQTVFPPALEPGRRNEFRAEMIEYWEGFRANGAVSEPRRYLLVLGRRR